MYCIYRYRSSLLNSSGSYSKTILNPTSNAFSVFLEETGKGTTNICVHVFYEEGQMGPLIWSHHLFYLIIIWINISLSK